MAGSGVKELGKDHWGKGDEADNKDRRHRSERNCTERGSRERKPIGRSESTVGAR